MRHFLRVGGDDNDARWWGILWDDSSSKRAEHDRHYLEAQLRQAQKMEAIGQLTGGVAHDFNNILANILGYTYLAEEHLASRPDGKLSTYMDEVRRAGERARDLVAQMLAFSRGGGGEAKPMVMAPVVLEVVKLLQSTLPASVQGQDPSGPPGAGCADRPGTAASVGDESLHQCQGRHAGYRWDQYRCQSDGRDQSHLRFLWRVFSRSLRRGVGQRFRAGDTTRSPRQNVRAVFSTKEFGKGSGMGLSMIHGIAHEHGGHILVETSASGGATIRLLLAVSEPVAVSGETVPVVEAVLPPNSTGHILVVDDEQSVARFLSDLLEGRGYEVTYLTSSRAAVTIFDTEPKGFDLVLTDQTMPEMSGIELAQVLVKKRPDLPVILCTGYSESVDEKQLGKQGIQGYVTKPIDIPVLLSLVEELLEGNRSDRNVIDGMSRFQRH